MKLSNIFGTIVILLILTLVILIFILTGLAIGDKFELDTVMKNTNCENINNFKSSCYDLNMQYTYCIELEMQLKQNLQCQIKETSN